MVSSRRRVLASLAATLGIGAGCAELSASGPTPSSTPAPLPSATDPDGPSTPGKPSSLPVPKERLVKAAPRDGIPAVTEPAFGSSWEGITVQAESTLRGEFTVALELRPTDASLAFDSTAGRVPTR